MGFIEKTKVAEDPHITRHKELHAALDNLAADYVAHTGKLLSETSVLELLGWSYKQTKNPD